jgi:Putative zinc ribbon domain
MKNDNICQSCGMPLDSYEILGTEKYGSLSLEYCKYCYQEGLFTNPDMTIEDMKTIVVTEMEKRDIDPLIIESAVGNLPNLKRWKKYPEYILL